MPSLEKSLRNQLERTVKDAREVAEAGARAAIEQLGVGEPSIPDHLGTEERNLRKRLRIHGQQLGDEPGNKKGSQGIERLVEEVAYEHWHRMLFARFLAENNLLMYPDPEEPVAVSLVECDDLAADERASNGWELASRFATQMLPAIFRIESPVFGLTLPPENQQRLEKLVGDLPADVFTASDSLGWVYQFWQANRKEAINKSEVKIGARELPAVTQLFTEDYMVDFLLDNTLGAWWAGKKGGSFPCSVFGTEEDVRKALSLPGCEWNYLRFIKTDQDDPSITETADRQVEPETFCWRPAAGTFDGWPKAAKDLKCLDPCMGSGHFIVAMFERLVALRMAEEPVDEATAIDAVIRNNLFGLEIDPRCSQIAAFNLAFAAWRRVGYRVLPALNLACSGLAPNVPESEWLALAGDNEKLRGGMERLYRLFENAPILGSLINPYVEKGDLLEAGFHELQPLLEKVIAQEQNYNSSHEVAVIARGVAMAAEILASQFTLVATNVPYLGRPKQNEILADHCERVHNEAKADLATCFLERCLTLCTTCGTASVVSPQNWLFLAGFKKLRERLLVERKWDLLARLGPRAFETIGGEVVNVVLLAISRQKRTNGDVLAGLDASLAAEPMAKAAILRGEMAGAVLLVSQEQQLAKPDARVNFDLSSDSELLSKRAYCFQGSSMMDMERLRLSFWEILHYGDEWDLHLSSPTGDADYTGCHYVSAVHHRCDINDLANLLKIEGRLGGWNSGRQLVGKRGVTVAWFGDLPTGMYPGKPFDHSAAAIVPYEESHLPAIWCFCADPVFQQEVRKIDQKAQVANTSFVKVPFDLAYWQKVADEKYPNGLPKPFSSDPTQWLFNGHPAGSDQPLQVAVARLLGYQWPRQTGSSFPDCPALGPDGLEAHADHDGIVCIPPVRGEAGAADRLLNLLAAAYGDQWSNDLLSQLLADAGYAGKGLEVWLRDGFFAQHLDIFHKRPFIWHIWDGLRDGFSVLVNYHKLDRKNLETLIYTYLGNWIDRQRQELIAQTDGAEEKLAAAEQLKKRLELILHGEAPYDIFVRWKPLHEQPIGWQPDINDGVRMNIRPFVTVPDVKTKGAGILRTNPKIKWDKDRGKEPQRDKADYPWFWGWDGKTTDFAGGPDFKGERFNDCHYTLAAKTKARRMSK